MDITSSLGALTASLTFPVVLVAAIVAGIFAFCGYTLFKKCLALFGAVAFGVAGSTLATTYLANVSVPLINLSSIIGIVCAVIGAVLMIYVYKLAIFVVGAAGGYFAAQIIIVPMLQLEGTVALIASAAAAIVVAILAVLLFKPLFILLTSVVTMTGVGAVSAFALFVEPTMIFVAVTAVIGLIVGICAAKKQFTDHKGKA